TPAKKKDPNAPKGPKPSYFHFSMAKRPEMIAEDSSLSMGDISKKIGALWKELSKEEKALYIEAAKVEKDAYAVVLAAYKAT
ncbi:high mobility group box domain-containing protein, partial [Pelagophyceae sp. CCMP2097]